MTALSMAEVKNRLLAFAKAFKDAKDEQQQASIFWTRFYECYGIRAEEATIYEQRVHKLDGKRGRIDSFIPGLLIVEHKSMGRDLNSAYEQASDYFLALAPAERPKYIITSDFARIRLYDLAAKSTYECTLAQLPSKANWFKFLMQTDDVEIVEETPINRNAAYAISKLHEALVKNKFKGEDLEVFLTRLLFCMFADDTGIFSEDQLLRRLLANTRADGSDLGSKLVELFEVLNTPVADRQTTLDEQLAAFPYVNGSLFSERTRIPSFNSELRAALIECSILDWSKISPAIFGAMFQGVLEEHDTTAKRQATRRELGAHYTSERNILRVINPLFMDDLRAELEAARRSRPKLQALYDKLPKLKFFDPACGCGNFLVIAYRELRRFEFEVIAELFNFEHGKGLLDVSTLCRVQLTQFYGIEIDDAAVHIARVALYITDHQLNIEAAERFGNTRASVPLTHTPNIVCDNAVRKDWNDVLPASECSYIISNPPFYGKQFQTAKQKADLESVAGKVKGFGVLDYVTCWYFKAAEYLDGNGTKVALVSTNSITQGEQVSVLWRGLAKYRLNINFAHRTFKWSNEGKANAAVHCVIIGFSQQTSATYRLFDYAAGIDKEPTEFAVSQINAYLVDAGWMLLDNKKASICGARPISYGSFALDDGHFTLSAEEKDLFISSAPLQASVLKPFIGAREFLHNEERYAIWLQDVEPSLLKSMPDVMKRVALVRDWRLKSGRANTVALARTPMLFAEIRQPQGDYLAIPTVSSERRFYLPIAMLSADTIASNQLYVVANSDSYQFGVLSSSMHMAWIRTVCGRLKSDIRYSASIVYNNFVWPISLSEAQRSLVAQTASAIVECRQKFSSSTLADLYDPLRMPSELLKAHEANDKAVDKAYGYKGASDDASRAAFLFKLYEQATSLLPSVATSKRKTKPVA